MNATCQTPVWVGIHNGTFDTYDRDANASAVLEPLAEDGNNDPIVADFSAVNGTVWDGTVGEAPICYGESAELPFEFAVETGAALYFSYASMVIPSNDAFVSNGDPMEYEVIGSDGEAKNLTIEIMGSEVLDAGTEVNDEIPENTAFFGQTKPGTGEDENGVVVLHEGFNSIGSGGILDDPKFVNANFTADGYKMMNITVAFENVAQSGDTSSARPPVKSIAALVASMSAWAAVW